jgi:hypothetical protein
LNGYFVLAIRVGLKSNAAQNLQENYVRPLWVKSRHSRRKKSAAYDASPAVEALAMARRNWPAASTGWGSITEKVTVSIPSPPVGDCRSNGASSKPFAINIAVTSPSPFTET